MGIAHNIKVIKERIHNAALRSGRSPQDIQLVAVTKHVPAERVREALLAGVGDLGENRVQEGLSKMAFLEEYHPKWHLIGSLQTNKVRQTVPAFALIHSLDRWRLAEALALWGEELQTVIPVLIEVNVSGEASKHGMSPAELPDFLDAICNLHYLKPRGLMTMAPYVENPEETRPVFRELKSLLKTMAETRDLGPEWKELSMGMSNDYEVAVEEGATFVRVGTAIFS
ncbi:MAG TPA: YggS family pyridoxal phosphate-dependent enzyme [Bacillota bacterium]|nr:YggS family pyridoxal phosphate-dependent enzyme [Bacillota bacterium]